MGHLKSFLPFIPSSLLAILRGEDDEEAEAEQDEDRVNFGEVSRDAGNRQAVTAVARYF